MEQGNKQNVKLNYREARVQRITEDLARDLKEVASHADKLRASRFPGQIGRNLQQEAEADQLIAQLAREEYETW